jgi:antitoxin VapB
VRRDEVPGRIIEPVSRRSLLAFLATLRPIAEDFPPMRELPPETVDF